MRNDKGAVSGEMFKGAVSWEMLKVQSHEKCLSTEDKRWQIVQGSGVLVLSAEKSFSRWELGKMQKSFRFESEKINANNFAISLVSEKLCFWQLLFTCESANKETKKATVQRKRNWTRRVSFWYRLPVYQSLLWKRLEIQWAESYRHI